MSKPANASFVNYAVRFKLGLIAALCLSISAAALLLAPHSKAMPFTWFASRAVMTPATAPASGTFYFHGVTQDEANKALTFADATNRGTGTWSSTAPTGSTAIIQKTSQRANADYVVNSFSGAINGNLQLNLFWSTPNAETTLLGEDVQVTVFGDPEYVSSRVQAQHIIGRGTVSISGVGPTPVLIQSTIPVSGYVANELMIQIVPVHSDTGAALLLHYDSTDAPSSFTLTDGGSSTPTPTPTPNTTPTPNSTPTPPVSPDTPQYANYYAPDGVADSWG